LTDEESVPSRDLSQWRGALTEHQQLLKRWEEAWVGVCGHVTALMGPVVVPVAACGPAEIRPACLALAG